MPTIQELIEQGKEQAVTLQKNIFDLQEKEKREREEAYRDKTLAQRAIDEAATQLTVYEEVEGFGKQLASEMGVEILNDPDALFGVIAYLWRHPSGQTPIPENSMKENLGRYKREHDKQKKKKKS
jgi:acetyl-CoA carboxylase alpha subunit